MKNQRKAGVLLGYSNIVVKNVVNLLYTPMLLAFIGQGEYGVYQTAYQFVFSLQLLSFGFSAAYVRFYTLRKIRQDTEGIRTLNGMYLVLYVIICSLAIMIGLVCSGLSSRLFSESFTATETVLASSLMSIMTINVAATLLSTVFDAYIVAHERFTFQQTRQMVTTLATPGLALALLILGYGAIGVALAQLAVNLVLLFLNASYAIRKLSMRFTIRGFDVNLLKALIGFSSWLFVNQITDLVVLNFPSVILGAVSGAAVVAVFSISVQLRTLFFSLSTTVSNVFVPLVNQIVASANDNKELTELLTRIGRYQAIFLCWILGGFAVLGRWFVSVWAGEEYLDAYWLTLAMVVPFMIPLVQNVGIEIQKAKNRHRARSAVYLICAMIDMVLTYALASALGYWAAAIGCVCYTILGPCLFINWYNHFRIGLDMTTFWKQVAPVFGVCAVSALVCCFFSGTFPVDNVVSFLLWGIVYTSLYGVLVLTLVMRKEERRSIFGKIARLFCGSTIQR